MAIIVYDCISREEAIRTIKDLYKKCDTENMQDYRDLLVEAFDALTPTDAVPVVRCKDCRWWDIGECKHKLALIVGNDEYYCSYGVRKDGEKPCPIT